MAKGALVLTALSVLSFLVASCGQKDTGTTLDSESPAAEEAMDSDEVAELKPAMEDVVQPASTDASSTAQGDTGLADLSGLELLNKAKCVACHGVKEQRIGPSYENIAMMYADADSETINRLARKVVVGGGGNWGRVPMVANPHVDIKDAKRMMDWIIFESTENSAE